MKVKKVDCIPGPGLNSISGTCNFALLKSGLGGSVQLMAGSNALESLEVRHLSKSREHDAYVCEG